MDQLIISPDIDFLEEIRRKIKVCQMGTGTEIDFFEAVENQIQVG